MKATARLTPAQTYAAQVKADRRAEALARRAERQAGLLTETDERKALYAQVGR